MQHNENLNLPPNLERQTSVLSQAHNPWYDSLEDALKHENDSAVPLDEELEWSDEDEDFSGDLSDASSGEYVDVEMDQDGPTGRMNVHSPHLTQVLQSHPAFSLTPPTLQLTLIQLKQLIRLIISKSVPDILMSPNLPPPEVIHPVLRRLTSTSVRAALSEIESNPSFTATLHSDSEIFPLSSWVLPLPSIDTGDSVVVSYRSIFDRLFLSRLEMFLRLPTPPPADAGVTQFLSELIGRAP